MFFLLTFLNFCCAGPFHRLFGDYNPHDLVLEAFGILPAPRAICYKSPHDCGEWYESERGGKALRDLSNRMPEDYSWQQRLTPIIVNELFLLALLKPQNHSAYLRSLIKGLDRVPSSFKNSPAYPIFIIFTGLMVADQCHTGNYYAEIAEGLRQFIVHRILGAEIQIFDAKAPNEVLKYLNSKGISNVTLLAGLWKWKTAILQKWHRLGKCHWLPPKQNDLDYSRMFSDLTNQELVDLISAIEHGPAWQVRWVYACLVDWQLANDVIDHYGLFPKLLSFILNGRLDEQDQLTVYLESWKKARTLAPLQQICRNPRFHSEMHLDCALLNGIPSITLTSVASAVLSGQEISERKEITVAWIRSQKEIAKYRELHSRNLSQYKAATVLAIANSQYSDLLTDDTVELLASSQVGPPAPPLIDVMTMASFREAGPVNSKIASLTLLLLTQFINITPAQLVRMLPLDLEVTENALLGFFGDNVASHMEGLNSGLFQCHSSRLLLDTFRALYLQPPMDCPIGRETVIKTLGMMLVFHLASVKEMDREPKLLHGHLIDMMEVGDILLLPSSSMKHALVYTIRREEEYTYLVTIYNSGYGNDLHQYSGSEERRIPYRSYRVPRSELIAKNYFCKTLLPDELIVEHLYPDAKYAIPSSAEEVLRWEKGPQKAGTCHSKSLLFWLRSHFETEHERLWFKAYNIHHHSGHLDTKISSINFNGMKEIIEAYWKIELSSIHCKKLQDPNISLSKAIKRHYCFRLAGELKKVEGNENVLHMLIEVLSNDIDARICFRKSFLPRNQRLAN